MRRRGIGRLALRKAVRRAGVFGCMRLKGSCLGKLLGLAVERMALEIGIVLLFLQTRWSVRALLVPRGDITGDGLAFRFCFRALEDDKIARHRDL